MEDIMNNFSPNTCAFCKTTIRPTDRTRVCSVCNAVHHESCWMQNNGCSTVGCSMQNCENNHAQPQNYAQPAPAAAVTPPAAPPVAAPMPNQPYNPAPQAAPQAPSQVLCTACKTPIQPHQQFCPRCGTPKPSAQNNCSKCGAALSPGQQFCPVCGQSANAYINPNVSAAINQFNQQVQPPKKKKTGLIITLSIVGGLFALILIFAVIGAFSTPKFDNMFSEYKYEDWCYISSDGTYMTLDTNPFDHDDNYYDDTLDWDCWEAIQEVNSELGFYYGIDDDMMETTYIDGTQWAYADGYSACWTYHPDTGLEVTYYID